MSRNCQLFARRVRSACFHARVKVSMVKLPLIRRALLPFRDEFIVAGMRWSLAAGSAAIFVSISRGKCSDGPEDGQR